MIKDVHLNRRRLFPHFFFWSAYVLINGFVWGYCGHINADYFLSAYKSTLLLTPFLMIAVYVNLYYLLPAFFIRKKYSRYALAIGLLYVVLAIIIRCLFYYGLGGVYGIDGQKVEAFDPYYVGKIMILHISPVLVVSTVIKMWQLWYRQQHRAQELQKEKLDAELKFLRGQIHPHFLFNTLNNLYSLTLQKSDKAPHMVLKLSDIMSYMLYDTQEDKIELEKEIRHISNYIELERLRYGSRLDLSFEVSGSTYGKYVAPLVLMPFVENAFKHSAGNDIEQAWIRIELTITDDTLWVKVENSKTALEGAGPAKGIGLINVKRRLALLYPNQHELTAEKEIDKYAVDLKLNFI